MATESSTIAALRLELWRLVEQAPQVDMTGTLSAGIVGYRADSHPVAILTTREEIQRLRKVADGE